MTDTKNTKPAKTEPTPKVVESKVPVEFRNPETGKYRPGYDAKHAGIVARKVLETGKTSHLSELPTEALRRKAAALVELWTAKADAKHEAQVARETAAEAKRLAKIEADAAKAEAKAAKS